MGSEMARKVSQLPTKKCGVLGCTGSVGQRFILLLAGHPHFQLHAIGASERSSGRKYKDVVQWKQTERMSAALGELEIHPCKPEYFNDCDIIFSGLDSSVAGEIETAFLNSDLAVFSNAKNHRQDPLVPLVVPTVNLSHLSLLPPQRHQHSLQKGFLVCNSNCAVTGLVVPFHALNACFPSNPIAVASVVTQQALSGAGYPGVSALDIKDNVIPYISGEEDKFEPECRKILGSVSTSRSDGESDSSLNSTTILPQKDLRISATCTRVDVTDGHTAIVSVRFTHQPAPPLSQIKQALSSYVSEAQTLGCPSAPSQAIWLHEEQDRPQPRLDRGGDGGYCVHVGRVREDPSGVWDLLFVSLSHNTVIGAAGSSLLNAEAAVLKGLV